MSDMSWHNILTRLGSILQGIDATLLTRTHIYAPRELSDVELPAVILFPRAIVDRTKQGADRWNETRQIDVNVYLSNARLGIDKEAEETALDYDYLDTIAQELFARPRLELNDNGLSVNVQVGNDSGLQMLEYPQNTGALYLGFVLPVLITKTVKVQLKRSNNP